MERERVNKLSKRVDELEKQSGSTGKIPFMAIWSDLHEAGIYWTKPHNSPDRERLTESDLERLQDEVDTLLIVDWSQDERQALPGATVVSWDDTDD